MPNTNTNTSSPLIETIETGLGADIFYDAHDHDDHEAETVIEDFHNSVALAIAQLKLIANLDTSGDTLSDADFAILKTIQATIKS